MCSAYIFLFLLNWISCCIFSFFGVNWTYGRLSSTRYFGLLLLKRAVCVCVYVCVVFLFLSFLYISHASYFPCKISVSWRLLAENKLSKSTERLVFFQGCPNSLFFFFFFAVYTGAVSQLKARWTWESSLRQSSAPLSASINQRENKKKKEGEKNSFSALQPALSSEVSYVAMVMIITLLWLLHYCYFLWEHTSTIQTLFFFSFVSSIRFVA